VAPVQLQFLGCGDAFGTGGRFNTCFMVTADDTRFLIDCGASSMVAMGRFGVDPDSIDRILLSHLHGDHFGGLPFLLLHARIVKERTKPLVVVGPETTRRRLMDTIECLFPRAAEKEWGFDLDIQEYELEKEWQSGPVTLTPYRARHHAGEGPACAIRVGIGGRTVTYSGDGAWSDGLAAAAAGADLFIVECFSLDPRIGGSGHMDLAMLEAGLEALEPKPARVVLTHFGEDMLAHAANVDFETAEDGKIVEF